jgi:hypothetical protein
MINIVINFFGFFIIISFVSNTIAQDRIPTKAEFDSLMTNAAMQMNAQMGGQKIDEFTNFKFITYDKIPPLFTYFYSSNPFSMPNINKLDKNQTEAMAKYHISKTCASPFRVFMKPYGLKVAHRFENGHTGLTLFKLTVSHSDC